ncbi:hypothetical protein [Streptomyces sp. TRM68367]|uniref:hypothetical protein n=1 Tax=Streptomyces sp. TRM68367 TaxID=2758415 RepID=UPI00165B480D|nr:hypothetical protein [Streptomyces sp. TRM68367]MBC9730896.1 hypothetical protein [Streptomyces sp. TRM68367]
MTVRFLAGNVLKVSVAAGSSAYALMLEKRPYIAFYAGGEGAGGDLPDLAKPPAFIVAVAKSAYSGGRWGDVLGRVSKDSLPAIPQFFRQNVMDPSDCEIVEADGQTRKASPADCVDLERSAVWSAEHIEKRLGDYFAGRPNAFVESMRVKL